MIGPHPNILGVDTGNILLRARQFEDKNMAGRDSDLQEFDCLRDAN